MREVVAAIVAIVKAALEAITSVVWSFCKRTGRWVATKVAKPVGDCFTRSVVTVGQAAVGLVPDVLRAGLKLPGQVLRGTGAVLEGGGRLAGATLAAAAAIPGAISSGLAAGGRQMPPPPSASAPQNQQVTADVQNALADLALQREMLRHARQITTPGAEAPVAKGSLEASFVCRFAQASRDERDEMDIETLPAHLQSWLLSLDERQLGKLAAGGVGVCERAITGRRTGIVGLPIPSETDYKPLPPRDVTGGMSVGSVLQDRNALGSRIAAAKGIRHEREPLY